MSPTWCCFLREEWPIFHVDRRLFPAPFKTHLSTSAKAACVLVCSLFFMYSTYGKCMGYLDLCRGCITMGLACMPTVHLCFSIFLLWFWTHDHLQLKKMSWNIQSSKLFVVGEAGLVYKNLNNTIQKPMVELVLFL